MCTPQSLLQLLPHRWQDRSDTQLLPLHILPDRVVDAAAASSSDSGAASSAALLFPTVAAPSLFTWGQGQKKRPSDRVSDHANVIVAKIHVRDRSPFPFRKPLIVHATGRHRGHPLLHRANRVSDGAGPGHVRLAVCVR